MEPGILSLPVSEEFVDGGGGLVEGWLKEILKRVPGVGHRFESWGGEYVGCHDWGHRFLMLWTHWPLLSLVRGFGVGLRVCEVGAGEGLISTVLSWMGYRVVVVDNDEGVLGYAEGYSRGDGGCQEFRYGDALVPGGIPEVDVVVSHGLLEHFGDDDIRRIVRNMQGSARLGVVFCVPSVWYLPWWSNARHMGIGRWREILDGYGFELSYYGEVKPLSFVHKVLSLIGWRNVFIRGVWRR